MTRWHKDLDPANAPADFDPDKAFVEMLTGDVEPLRRFGVMLVDVPWWRRRIQRYVMPGRYRLWVQRKILEMMDDV